MSVDGPRQADANQTQWAPSDFVDRLSQPLSDEPKLLDELIHAVNGFDSRRTGANPGWGARFQRP